MGKSLNKIYKLTLKHVMQKYCSGEFYPYYPLGRRIEEGGRRKDGWVIRWHSKLTVIGLNIAGLMESVFFVLWMLDVLMP